jgi:hypothetical protein
MISHVTRPFLATMVALLPIGSAVAIEYHLGGQLYLEANHNSNLLLTQPGQSTAGQLGSARLDLGAATENTSAALDMTLHARSYGLDEYNSDDQTVNARYRHQRERSAYGVDLGIIRDSTLTSELLDSGRLGESTRREQYSASPYMDYQLGERDSLSARVSYIESKYDRGDYVDYQYWTSALTWSHLLRERLNGFAQIIYSRYESDEIAAALDQSYSTHSREYGLLLGGEYQFSERLKLSAIAGQTRSRSTPSISDPGNVCESAAQFGLTPLFPLCTLEETTSRISTLDLSINWTTERNMLSARATRRNQPSSSGYLQETDQLDLNWRYRLSPRGAISTALTAGTTDVSGDYPVNRFDPSRDFGYGTLAYAHRLSERWTLQCSYQYRMQKYDDQDLTKSHVGSLAIIWKPQEKRWSR